jgi:hypothetical protein
MIQVLPAPEPPAFDQLVRQPGLSAIDELVGRPPRVPRPGPRRTAIAAQESDLPGEAFPPFWREASAELLAAYGRRCAFLALYLEHATGNPSFDHWLPKSRHWEQVYEWSNYRLCAASVNTRKNAFTGLVDPFECQPGWFEIELVGFQVVRGVHAPAHLHAEIQATLDLLNDPEFCRARGEYVVEYAAGHILIDYLCRRAPFVALELQRQGRLRPGDQVP